MFLHYNSGIIASVLLTVLSLRDFVHSSMVSEVARDAAAPIKPLLAHAIFPEGLKHLANGPDVEKAFQKVYQEIDHAGLAESIDDHLKYEIAPNPHQLSLEEEETGSGAVEEIPDLKANAKILIAHQPGAHKESILRSGELKTEAYQKLLTEANEAGNYGFVLNGEGPDMPSTAAYISMIKKSPQGIFIRPRNEDPIANIDEFNRALQAMEQDEKYGKLKIPQAERLNDVVYAQFAKKIRERIEETGKPFNLVVFGSGEPIVKLMAGDLKDVKYRIIFSHITPYFWQENPMTKKDIRWMLGSNVAKDPAVERSIFELGVKRLAIHVAASKLQHFSNLIDREEAGLRLTNAPDVNLNDSGAIAGMKAYFSKNSPSLVGRYLGAAMRDAFEHNSKKEITEQDIALLGHEIFKNMPETERRRIATQEVLRVALQVYVEAHPEVVYQKMDNKELESFVFWKEHGLEAFQEACAKFPDYDDKKKYGIVPNVKELQMRDLAHWTFFKPFSYTGMLRHRQLMVPLIAMAERDGKLTVHIHASEAQAIITAITGHGGEKPVIPFYGIPVSFVEPVNALTRENFNLKLDTAGSTLVVTGVDQKKLLRVHEAFFKLPSTNTHSQ